MKTSVFYCCFVWLCQKNIYRSQNCAEIIGLCINLSAEGFPLFLHCIVAAKGHDLLKLLHRELVSTIFKGLFQRFRQRCTVKINLFAR